MTFNSKKFSVGPEHILVVPKMESDRYGGVYGELVQHADDAQMGIGTVVDVGKMPKGFRNIRPGDTIAFARGVMTPVTTTLDGKEVECKIVSLIDYRGKFIEDETSSGFSVIALFRKIWRRNEDR